MILNIIHTFVLFLLDIVLSAPLRFTNSDYPFGIFKLFLHNIFILSSYLHDTEYVIWIILVILTKVDDLDLFPNVK